MFYNENNHPTNVAKGLNAENNAVVPNPPPHWLNRASPITIHASSRVTMMFRVTESVFWVMLNHKTQRIIQNVYHGTKAAKLVTNVFYVAHSNVQLKNQY